MTDFAFKLELPTRRPFFSAALVAQLTTHAIWPEGDSVEAIIERIDPMAYDDYQETELSADFLDYIKKVIDEPEVSPPSIPKLAKVKRVAVWNRFSAASDHYTELCAMYRKGEIAFLDPVSFLPVDPKISDFELRSANVPFAGLARFANSLGIEVTMQALDTVPSTDLQKDEALSYKEKTTLLVIAGLLCKEAKINHQVPAKSADALVHIADGMGVQISKRTIQNYLKEIQKALESRMK
jgi:hypothetical protein